MKELTREQAQELYRANIEHTKEYVKSGTFLFRKAVEGEIVLTVVAGKLETFKHLHEGDSILTNLTIGGSAEMYAISGQKFTERYRPIPDKQVVLNGATWGMAKAIGEIRAFEYHGDPIIIDAPWGEQMIVEEGDFIGNPIPGEPTDIYRVEKETFYQTYKEKVAEIVGFSA